MDSQAQQGYFFADSYHMQEIVRLLKQNAIIERATKGYVFPRDVSTENLHAVLDVACGPGSWALEVAEKYPHLQVFGIDVSEAMIEYARVQANARSLTNATFYVANATQRLPFPDKSFDFVNNRFIVGFMRRDQWPQLVQECTRLLRPNGILSFTESDNSTMVGAPALYELSDVIATSMWKRRQGFSPTRTMGTTAMLSLFLEEHGYQSIDYSCLAIDFSFGAEAHEAYIDNFLESWKLMKPMVLQTIDEEKFFDIEKRAREEVSNLGFHALWYIVTAYGTKYS